MAKYKKKPVVIEAIQFKRDCFEDIIKFTGGKAINCRTEKCINGKSYCDIETLEGVMTATEDDYIIKGVQGEFYPCKPDIFEQTYDLADCNSVQPPKQDGMKNPFPRKLQNMEAGSITIKLEVEGYEKIEAQLNEIKSKLIDSDIHVDCINNKSEVLAAKNAIKTAKVFKEFIEEINENKRGTI